jgi:hypothetical protein
MIAQFIDDFINMIGWGLAIALGLIGIGLCVGIGWHTASYLIDGIANNMGIALE